jgi:hypothetical protein
MLHGLISRTCQSIGGLKLRSDPSSDVQGMHEDLEATSNSSGQRVDSLAYTPFGA